MFSSSQTGLKGLTNGIRSVWRACSKHSNSFAIKLGDLYFGLEASVITTPEVLKVSVAMEYVYNPAVAVANQPFQTGMGDARPVQNSAESVADVDKSACKCCCFSPSDLLGSRCNSCEKLQVLA